MGQGIIASPDNPGWWRPLLSVRVGSLEFHGLDRLSEFVVTEFIPAARGLSPSTVE